MKEPLKLRSISILISYQDTSYGSHIGSVEFPAEAGHSTLEEAAKGVIPMLLEVAHNNFVDAKNKRQAEINAELSAEESATPKEEEAF